MSEHRILLELLAAAAPSEPQAVSLLRSMLDLLPVTIVITDARGRIVHVNKAGADMLAARDPVWSHHGHLNADAAKTTKALTTAINTAALRKANGHLTATSEMEVALPCRNGRVAIAHARPLYLGSTCFERATDGAVAVFITNPTRAAPRLSALARHFELTPAETRVLEEIASGKSRKGAALALGLADSTIKTHLENIYAKAGTPGRLALCRLVQEVTWPDGYVGS